MTKELEEHEIRRLHAEFSSLVKYRDRLSLYDNAFGLFNYSFPRFDPELEMLFKPEKISVIDDLFERERRNSFVPEKKFLFSTQSFVFNVAPLNSNAEIFNDYIVTKFIESDTAFNEITSRLEERNNANVEPIKKMYARATRNVRLIEEQVYASNETSWRSQFMTVFYNGYIDHRNNIFKKFPRRKKIIELYLYSQGILLGKYIDALHGFFAKTGDNRYERSGVPDLNARLDLFTELGIISLLTKKYRKLGQQLAEEEIAGVICLMLGENRAYYDQVLDYLRAKGYTANV